MGLSKRIGRHSGVTCLFGVPVAPFSVQGSIRSSARGPVGSAELRYGCLPVVDVLSPRVDGTWDGRALVLGVELCRFRLVRPRS